VAVLELGQFADELFNHTTHSSGELRPACCLLVGPRFITEIRGRNQRAAHGAVATNVHTACTSPPLLPSERNAFPTNQREGTWAIGWQPMPRTAARARALLAATRSSTPRR